MNKHTDTNTLTFVLLHIIAGKPAGHLAQSALPPAAILALCNRYDVALVEAKLIVVLAFERELGLHNVQVHDDV